MGSKYGFDEPPPLVPAQPKSKYGFDDDPTPPPAVARSKYGFDEPTPDAPADKVQSWWNGPKVIVPPPQESAQFQWYDKRAVNRLLTPRPPKPGPGPADEYGESGAAGTPSSAKAYAARVKALRDSGGMTRAAEAAERWRAEDAGLEKGETEKNLVTNKPQAAPGTWDWITELPARVGHRTLNTADLLGELADQGADPYGLSHKRIPVQAEAKAALGTLPTAEQSVAQTDAATADVTKRMEATQALQKRREEMPWTKRLGEGVANDLLNITKGAIQIPVGLVRGAGYLSSGAPASERVAATGRMVDALGSGLKERAADVGSDLWHLATDPVGQPSADAGHTLLDTPISTILDVETPFAVGRDLARGAARSSLKAAEREAARPALDAANEARRAITAKRGEALGEADAEIADLTQRRDSLPANDPRRAQLDEAVTAITNRRAGEDAAANLAERRVPQPPTSKPVYTQERRYLDKTKVLLDAKDMRGARGGEMTQGEALALLAEREKTAQRTLYRSERDRLKVQFDLAKERQRLRDVERFERGLAGRQGIARVGETAIGAEDAARSVRPDLAGELGQQVRREGRMAGEAERAGQRAEAATTRASETVDEGMARAAERHDALVAQGEAATRAGFDRAREAAREALLKLNRSPVEGADVLAELKAAHKEAKALADEAVMRRVETEGLSADATATELGRLRAARAAAEQSAEQAGAMIERLERMPADAPGHHAVVAKQLRAEEGAAIKTYVRLDDAVVKIEARVDKLRSEYRGEWAGHARAAKDFAGDAAAAERVARIADRGQAEGLASRAAAEPAAEAIRQRALDRAQALRAEAATATTAAGRARLEAEAARAEQGLIRTASEVEDAKVAAEVGPEATARRAKVADLAAEQTVLRKAAQTARADAKAFSDLHAKMLASRRYEPVAKRVAGLPERAAALVTRAERLETTAKVLDMAVTVVNPLLGIPKLLGMAKNAAISGETARSAGLRWWFKDKDRVELALWAAARREAQAEVNGWYFDVLEKFRAIPEKDRPLVREALHMEHVLNETGYRLAELVKRDPKAPAGQRYTNIQNLDADPAVRLQAADWVERVNDADRAVDFLGIPERLTAESLETGLLNSREGLDEVWAPNSYLAPMRKEAALKRIQAKGYSREAAEQVWKEEQGMARESAGGERVAGRGEMKRTLRDVPIEKREELYGMVKDLSDTLFTGYMRQKQDIAHQRMWQGIAKDPNMVSQVSRPGWERVTNGKRQSGGTQPFADALPKDFWLHPDIAADMRWTQAFAKATTSTGWSTGAAWFANLVVKPTRWFKTAHTALSLGTAATNVFGNLLVLAPMAGMSPGNPLNAKYYKTALREILSGEKGALYREWVNARSADTTSALTRVDIPRAAEMGVAEILSGSGAFGRAKQTAKGFNDVLLAMMGGDRALLGRGVREVWDVAKSAPGAVYGAMDDVFKFAYWLKLREAGGDLVAYAAKASKAFGDYENLAGLARMIAISPIGIPFVAFNGRMLFERFPTWMRENPAMGAVWANLQDTMSNINLHDAHITPAMVEAIKQRLPSWDQNRLALAAEFIGADAERTDGKYQLGDIMKYAALGGLQPQGEEGWFGMLGRQFRSSSPIIGSYEITRNVDPAFGPDKKVYEDTDAPSVAAKKTMAALAKVWQSPFTVQGLFDGTPDWLLGYGERRIRDAEADRPRVGRNVAAEAPSTAQWMTLAGFRTAAFGDRELDKRAGRDLKTKKNANDRALKNTNEGTDPAWIRDPNREFQEGEKDRLDAEGEDLARLKGIDAMTAQPAKGGPPADARGVWDAYQARLKAFAENKGPITTSRDLRQELEAMKPALRGMGVHPQKDAERARYMRQWRQLGLSEDTIQKLTKPADLGGGKRWKGY